MELAIRVILLTAVSLVISFFSLSLRMGQALGQLSRQIVAQVSDDSAHASDSALLHLLVDVRSIEFVKTTFINLKKKKIS